MSGRGKIRNVALATETRAEYWLLRPIYRALDGQAGLRPTFLASGMHHLARFGRTIDAIRADGVRVRAIRTADGGDEDSPVERAARVARAVAGYGRALAEFDWLIVLGDRLEMLAAVTAAASLGVAVAHLHGGDVAPGAGDDAIRHAITKLAHVHFPATADAARRIRRLGEPAWRIRLAGAPAIDAIRQASWPEKAELDRLAGFDTSRPFAVVLQHAAGFPPRREQANLRATLEAVAEHFERAVVIGPGLDAGSGRLHETIARFVARKRSWSFAATLDQPSYFGLLSRAAALVGNSSSGLIESAHFRVPVVDVGPRQQGRLHSSNVLHCDYGRAAVSAAVRRALHDARFRRRVAICRNLYGTGRAGQAVARTLANMPIDRGLLIKAISY